MRADREDETNSLFFLNFLLHPKTLSIRSLLSLSTKTSENYKRMQIIQCGENCVSQRKQPFDGEIEMNVEECQ
jgi:hypothetical protein